MVSYRCIGYGITGNDGVATLDTNLDGTSMSHSYTGSGVGELDFVASVDSPTQINSGSEQSEPYTVYDCVFYDSGDANTHNPNWTNQDSTNIQVSYNSNGQTVIEGNIPSGTKSYYTTMNGSNNWRDSNIDYQIDIDVEFIIGENGIPSVYFGGVRFGLQSIMGSARSGKISLKTNGDSIVAWLEGSPTENTGTMSTINGFQFQFYRSATIKFKNLAIYRI